MGITSTTTPSKAAPIDISTKSVITENSTVRQDSTVVPTSAYESSLNELKLLILDVKRSLLEELHELRQQNQIISEENRELKEKLHQSVTQSSELRENLLQLQLQVDTIKQKELQNNIIITGLPNQEISPKDVFSRIISTIGVDIDSTEVEDCHYLRASPNSQHQNHRSNFLLVKFNTFSAKQKFISRKKAFKILLAEQIGFNTDNRTIFIRDHLTPNRSNLFRAAKDIKHRLNYKYLWTKDGRILLREQDKSKIIEVRSKFDLESLPQSKKAQH